MNKHRIQTRIHRHRPWYNLIKVLKATPIHVLLLLFVFVALFPIYLMFGASLKSSQETFQSFVALPKDPRWHNFYTILVEQSYYKSVINSVILASSTALLSTVFSILAAFGFTVYRFRGKQMLFVCCLSGLMISEASILIPVYNLLQDLSLLNTRVGQILPQTALGLAFGIFLMTTFFKEVPKELIEAGAIDGCSDVATLFYIIIPVTKQAILSLVLLEFMWAWNSFFFPLVIATQQSVMPMSVSIIDFMGRFTFDYEMIAVTCVIMSAPLIVLYLLTQRSFHRGVTFGALKE